MLDRANAGRESPTWRKTGYQEFAIALRGGGVDPSRICIGHDRSCFADGIEKNANGGDQACFTACRSVAYTQRRARIIAETSLTLASLRSRLRGLAGYSALPILVFHRLGWTAPIHVARLVWRHIRTERRRLYELQFASMWTSQPVLADAIRWQNPASITGGRRTALFAHPDSTVTWELTLPSHARVAAWAALLPNVWNLNTGGVRFSIEVTTPDGALLRENAILVRPGTIETDRRWRRVVVRMRNDKKLDVRVTLRTTVPPGATPEYAWAVWGDPQIERDRSPLEMTRFVRSSLAEHGVAGALLGLRVDLKGHAEDVLRYQRWVMKHTPDSQALAALATRIASLPLQPKISVLMPVYNTDPRWLRAAIDSVRAQIYANWELCIADDASTSPSTVAVLDEYAKDQRIQIVRRATNGHISAASNDALALATGDYIALLDHDDVLTPDALAEIVSEINAHPDSDVIYSDEDKLSVSGKRCDPFFKPDWSPEHFLGQMYTCHLTVARASLMREVGGFRVGLEGAQDYDLWLRMIARTSRIRHVPKILYHWRKIPGSAAAVVDAKPYALDNAARALSDHARSIGLDASVEPGLAPGMWRVRRRIKGHPDVTIVIPTAGRSAPLRGKQVDLLGHAVRSIVDKTTWPNYRLLIVDNGDLTAETLTAIERVPHRRVTYMQPPGPFNLAHKINFAVQHAETDYFVIFNDDIEIITPDWIEGLLEYIQDPAIGAVGCKLRFPDGRLQHVGVVTGITIAAHLFHQAPADAFGWNGGAMTVRNYSVVTGAVMMTRREAWDRVDGFDERLRIDFNDVDYCLKLRDAGYRIVFTPFVECYHHESGSFGARQQNPEDIAVMQRKWGETLDRDPYYNPNLTRQSPDCRLPD